MSVCECVWVCVSVCECVCVCVCECVSVCEWVWVCVSVCESVCECVWVCVIQMTPKKSEIRDQKNKPKKWNLILGYLDFRQEFTILYRITVAKYFSAKYVPLYSEMLQVYRFKYKTLDSDINFLIFYIIYIYLHIYIYMQIL